MNSSVERIKEAIDIVDLVSQYVQLKKRGGNYFGLCPFHAEKTPSFSVNPKGQFFHCFGCGESGDAITFYMKIENLEFKDAVKELAERYNIEIETKNRQKDPLIEIHKHANSYFQSKLYKNSKALDYLQKRQIDKQTIEIFNIGYCPPSSELLLDLKKRFGEEDLIKSGIFVKTQKGLYNRFSDRIIFPIKNAKGETIAFGGRIMEKTDKKAKYINSPETQLFSKQKVLYGLFEAKDSIRSENKIIITEGYMDCIRLSASGLKNTVATLGTALSRYHIAAIKRYTNNLYFNYDADEAGFKAMSRSAKNILSSNLFSFVIKLDKNEDPDSFILKNGVEAYMNRLQKADDYFAYLMDYLITKYDTKKPQNILKIIEEIKPALLGIQDATMRMHYISKASKLLNVSEDVFVQKNYQIKEFFANINKEDALLGLLLKDIELMSWIEDFESFAVNLDGKYKELYKTLLETYLTGEEFDFKGFVEKLADQKTKKLAYQLMSIEAIDMDNRFDRRKVFLSLITQFEKDSLSKKLNIIKEKLNDSPTEDLLNEYNELFLKLKEIVS